jgi:hypothetical protein
MTIQKHWCAVEKVRPGDQLDCPDCRAGLLAAFRRPADEPEPLPVHGPVAGPVAPAHPAEHYLCPFCPELLDNADQLSEHVEFVHTDRFGAWSGHPSSPAPQPGKLVWPEEQEPNIIEHTTDFEVDPREDGPGGTWRAWCSCGWEAAGLYARNTGQLPAARLARIKADRHRKESAAQ